MIISMRPITMAETRDLASKGEVAEGVANYFKTFCKLSFEDATKLAEELRGLNNVKFKEEHIVKIVDFLPKDAEEVHKICQDISLNEEEVNAILAAVKNY